MPIFSIVNVLQMLANFLQNLLGFTYQSLSASRKCHRLQLLSDGRLLHALFNWAGFQSVSKINFTLLGVLLNFVCLIIF